MIRFSTAFSRERAIFWTHERLGTPHGFDNYKEWSEWVNEVLNDSDLHQEYIYDEHTPVGFWAYQYGNSIHHKGRVLDIQMLVLAPHRRDSRKVWKEILRVAKLNKFSWVARRQHQPDGSIKTIYTEV